MEIQKLLNLYPKLYHMADKRNWDSICKHGLLSTTALLDLFEYKGERRFKIESQLRLDTILITHPFHGNSFIRDQDPMRDRPSDGICLEKCLEGITPQQWFEFLNRKTFFWADKKGLSFMLGAKLYRHKSHFVITVDTQKLIGRHADRVTLSPINSGSLYSMKKRSMETFKSISHHSARWVTELIVDYSVPDILDLTISVDECKSQRNNGKREKVCKKIKRVWPT